MKNRIKVNSLGFHFTPFEFKKKNEKWPVPSGNYESFINLGIRSGTHFHRIILDESDSFTKFYEKVFTMYTQRAVPHAQNKWIKMSDSIIGAKGGVIVFNLDGRKIVPGVPKKKDGEPTHYILKEHIEPNEILVIKSFDVTPMDIQISAYSEDLNKQRESEKVLTKYRKSFFRMINNIVESVDI